LADAACEHLSVQSLAVDPERRQKMQHLVFMRLLAFIGTVVFASAHSPSPRCAENGAGDEASRRQLAEELAERVAGKELVEAMWAQMKQGFSSTMQQLGIAERDRPIVEKYMEKMTAIMQEQLAWKKIRQPVIEIYARVYTESELRAINDLFKSASGQTYLAKMPEVVKESAEISQQMMQALVPRIQALEKEAIGEIRLLLATRDCNEMQPIEQKTVSGRWRSLDYPHVNHVNYKDDGTFSGFVESLGKVVSRFEGEWRLDDQRRTDIYTSHTSAKVPPGTSNSDEILAVGCGILTLRNQAGNTVRYGREADN
jgi:uncharacterized protein